MDYDCLARVALLFASVAHAEGFFHPDAIPRRHNNPCDVLDAAGANPQYVTRLAGAYVGVRQLELMLTGRSHVYKLDWTWLQIAEEYTGRDNAAAWAAIVCDDLGVFPDSTLRSFAGPVLEPQIPAVAQAESQVPAPAPAEPDAPSQS